MTAGGRRAWAAPALLVALLACATAAVVVGGASACDGVNCGVGTCKEVPPAPPILASPYECDCNPGWSRLDLLVPSTPCTLPACLSDPRCYMPKPKLPPFGSNVTADPCIVVDCGPEGTCVKEDNSPYFHCQCNPGTTNARNNPSLFCTNCVVGDDGCSVPPPPPSGPPPPPSSDPPPPPSPGGTSSACRGISCGMGICKEVPPLTLIQPSTHECDCQPGWSQLDFLVPTTPCNIPTCPPDPSCYIPKTKLLPLGSNITTDPCVVIDCGPEGTCIKEENSPRFHCQCNTGTTNARNNPSLFCTNCIVNDNGCSVPSPPPPPSTAPPGYVSLENMLQLLVLVAWFHIV